jgi:hypothetical protein
MVVETSLPKKLLLNLNRECVDVIIGERRRYMIEL